MKLLITGSEGYIGAVLTEMAQQAGHNVTGMDTCFYRTEALYPIAATYTLIKKDTRTVVADDFRVYDAIIHLADLSNDPLGVFREENTMDINLRGTVRVAKYAKEAGVGRFVYSSSCSVYGIASQEVVDETSAVNPQTQYAKCKVAVEKELVKLADSRFTPVILRNSTVYGASPMMRFDLVLNNLAGTAWTEKAIRMQSDGSPWRPLVHIHDACHAMLCAITAPKDTVRAETFNVGRNDGNYRVRDVARIVAAAFPGCEMTTGSLGGDTRSYRVNFDKIHAKLSGFTCMKTAEDGARELRELFERIHLTKEQFTSRDYTRIKQLEYLTGSGTIDEKFYWKNSKIKSKIQINDENSKF